MGASRQGQRNGRRLRRARRRGHMIPAEATKLSTRTRVHGAGWLITKSVTRFHRRERYWQDATKYYLWGGE